MNIASAINDFKKTLKKMYRQSRTVQLGKYKEPFLDLALATVAEKKQAIIFCNSKRSAEKTAEDIAKKCTSSLHELAEQIKTVLSQPTKQCLRLAYCVERGIAFHHAGLHPKQRELIEDAFKKGIITIIAATPTLAAGVDMPAFRTIIKDLRRFSSGYYDYIPVLEYHQMAGRAGRPGKEEKGEAIIIAKDEYEAEELIEKYLFGPPEVIYSKLAVEPVLRMYVLSLLATGYIKGKDALEEFFQKTFWAYQFQDMPRLLTILEKVVRLLYEWDFIDENFTVTRLGMRVSQLYLDPLSAYEIIKGIKRAKEKIPTTLSWLHLMSHCLEMRPWFTVKTKEYEWYDTYVTDHEDEFLTLVPSAFDYDYERFLQTVKTALFLEDWINEEIEQTLMEKYGIRPGEIIAKRDIADWLLYATQELARILGYHEFLNPLQKIRVRLQYGIKEELLPLVKIKNIGRARARLLWRHHLQSLQALRDVPYQQLARILGSGIAKQVKESLGIQIPEETIKKEKQKKKPQKKNKTGQQQLGDFS